MTESVTLCIEARESPPNWMSNDWLHCSSSVKYSWQWVREQKVTCSLTRVVWVIYFVCNVKCHSHNKDAQLHNPEPSFASLLPSGLVEKAAVEEMFMTRPGSWFVESLARSSVNLEILTQLKTCGAQNWLLIYPWVTDKKTFQAHAHFDWKPKKERKKDIL